MKLFHLIASLVIASISCSNTESKPHSDTKVEASELQDDYKYKSLETPDEDQALDALNEIQVNGDGKMMLYMTFPNIHHSECVGEIESIEISKAEFKSSLLKVMSVNNTGLSPERQLELASIASKPDSTYRVNICGANHVSNSGSSSITAPMSGTWIIREIFGTSDLLINW